MIRSSIVVLCLTCFAGYLALPQNSRPTDQSYLFAADAETLLYTPLSLSFSCEGREYGYYADPDNNCQVFHICLPLLDETETVVLETAHWSFICGNGTVFDQGTLTCNYAKDAIPCGDSSKFYNQIEYGRIPEKK